MVSEKLGEPMFPKAGRHEALEDVEVGIPVSFYEYRPILEDCDIPSDNDPIVEVAVSSDSGAFHLFPEGNGSALDGSTAVGVH